MTDIVSGRHSRILALAVVLAMACCTGLEAADAPEEPDFPHSLTTYYRHMPGRSVEAMPGEVEVMEAGAEYSWDFKAFGKLPVTISVEQEYVGIDDTLVDVELPSHLVGVSTDVETTVPLLRLKDTYLRVGISPSFYGDDWSMPASAFRIPFRAFVIHLPNERLVLLAGIAVYPDFEDEVAPILGFIYKPNERLAFNIVPKRPNISYLLNDHATVFVEGGGSLGAEYEVTRGTDKNVVLQYRSYRAGTGVKFKFNQHLQAALSAGGVFGRQFKYRDSIGKVNLKNGLYAECRVEVRL